MQIVQTTVLKTVRATRPHQLPKVFYINIKLLSRTQRNIFTRNKYQTFTINNYLHSPNTYPQDKLKSAKRILICPSFANANYGSRAQAEVHDANLVRVAHGDAKALQGTLQTLIDWMVALNFGENVPSPKGYFDIKNYATFQEVMQAVQNKVPLSKEALYTRYGLPRPEDDNDLFIVENQQPQTPFNFSDSKKKRSMIF